MAIKFDFMTAGSSALVSAASLKDTIIPSAMAEALYLDALATMEVSKDDYVPVATGELRDSGVVEEPVLQDADVIFVYLKYTAPYAVAVHEIPAPPDTSVGGRSARHPHGQWKYLETPVLERSAGMRERVGSHLMNEIQSHI